MGATPEKVKAVVINIEEVKRSKGGVSSSSPASPPFTLRKSSSGKFNCLCSPTTHAGSFRCKYHRNSGLTRNGVSVGSKLSELASIGSKLSELPSELSVFERK